MCYKKCGWELWPTEKNGNWDESEIQIFQFWLKSYFQKSSILGAFWMKIQNYSDNFMDKKILVWEEMYFVTEKQSFQQFLQNLPLGSVLGEEWFKHDMSSWIWVRWMGSHIDISAFL